MRRVPSPVKTTASPYQEPPFQLIQTTREPRKKEVVGRGRSCRSVVQRRASAYCSVPEVVRDSLHEDCKCRLVPSVGCSNRKCPLSGPQQYVKQLPFGLSLKVLGHYFTYCGGPGTSQYLFHSFGRSWQKCSNKYFPEIPEPPCTTTHYLDIPPQALESKQVLKHDYQLACRPRLNDCQRLFR